MPYREEKDECGNCTYYLKPECPRGYDHDTELWRSQKPCENFLPKARLSLKTNEEKQKTKVGQPPPPPQIAIAVIALIAIFFLVGIGIWWSTQSIPGISQTTFTFVVESNTEWSGAFGTVEEGQRTEDGFGDASFTFHGSIASACVQKMTDYGYLTVKIRRNGEVVASQTTTASYGVVTVSASS